MQWTNGGSKTQMQLEFTPNSCKLAEPGHQVSDLTSAQLKTAHNRNFTRINAERRAPIERTLRRVGAKGKSDIIVTVCD